MASDESLVISLKPKKLSRQERNRRERLFMIFTIGLIIAAWLFGYFTSGADVAPMVPEVLPGATSIQTQDRCF